MKAAASSCPPTTFGNWPTFFLHYKVDFECSHNCSSDAKHRLFQLSARSEPHRLSVSGRKINLISEESGEDDSPRAVVRSPDRAATNVPMRSSPDFYRGRSQTLGAGPSVGSPKLSPLGNGRSRTMGSPSPSPQPTAMQEEQLSPTKTPGTPRSRRMTMAARGEKKSCTIS